MLYHIEFFKNVAAVLSCIHVAAKKSETHLISSLCKWGGLLWMKIIFNKKSKFCLTKFKRFTKIHFVVDRNEYIVGIFSMKIQFYYF